MDKLNEIIEKLSPIERKIVPFLNLRIDEIIKKSGLDETSVLRALRFLENKELVKIKIGEEKIIDLGTNGIYYKKHNLPERNLLILLEKNNHLLLEEAKKLSKLSDNEFKVSLGVLKGKGMINLANGKISLNAGKDELIKKSLEEQLLSILPIEFNRLNSEQKYALENLKRRKNIVEIQTKNIIDFDLTEQGKEISGKEIKSDLIEEVTNEIILSHNKNIKFRKYDILAPVSKISGGKRHFVNQSVDYARRIWTDLGFKEMSGPIVDSAFWVFDALFTPQDHPAREMQDTFFIKDLKAKLPEKKIILNVKKSHEQGTEGSKGWNYQWKESEAEKVLLRTHTTSLSARTLAQLKQDDLPAKYFAIGKVFRNETLDWKHAFEFYQTEGIVIDENANFKYLLGYLQEFYKKMGFEKIKFVPSFFAYTEPSVEVQVWHPEKKEWVELGGAGIFRPEVTASLFGRAIPVLAWGQGFDRIIMDYYKIKDLREMYSNDIKQLREKEFWTK
ncbi:MAG: phenylalanine--tRNA ligase subunit alpha [Nanoarchaeota archaeon]